MSSKVADFHAVIELAGGMKSPEHQHFGAVATRTKNSKKMLSSEKQKTQR